METVAEPIASLSTSVDARFDEVTKAIVEQREYTENAFGTIQTEMRSGFSRLQRKLDHVFVGRGRRRRT